ncbi:hypothetical protein CCR75_005498 [Bremia lactucae]|uniref:RxLR effector protein n=1 Tax=Bremia lactucae TaxID=4779 RepID=A0A976NZJ9_BRELC|nr:hypothetical protein CCR75_005498 [Bremia lactucae]
MSFVTLKPATGRCRTVLLVALVLKGCIESSSVIATVSDNETTLSIGSGLGTNEDRSVKIGHVVPAVLSSNPFAAVYKRYAQMYSAYHKKLNQDEEFEELVRRYTLPHIALMVASAHIYPDLNTLVLRPLLFKKWGRGNFEGAFKDLNLNDASEALLARWQIWAEFGEWHGRIPIRSSHMDQVNSAYDAMSIFTELQKRMPKSIFVESVLNVLKADKK